MGEYRFGITGEQRKQLVNAISEILGTPAKYIGSVKHKYQIGDYQIDREGTVTGYPNLTLLAGLAERGFEPEERIAEPITDVEDEMNAPEAETPEEPVTEIVTETLEEPFTEPATETSETPSNTMETPESPTEPEDDSIRIEVPLNGFTPETIDNLCKMVAAKESLIKKALGVDALPIQVSENSIAFGWFNADHNEYIMPYAQFITQLCKTAKRKKRVTAKAQETFENEKFAMRVWLIGLGLVGDDFKTARKLLLQNLSGNGAWRYGVPEKDASGQEEAPEPLAPETEVYQQGEHAK